MHRLTLLFLLLACGTLAVGLAQEPPADQDPPPENPGAADDSPEEAADDAPDDEAARKAAEREALRKLPWFKREPFYEIHVQKKSSDPVEQSWIFPLKEIPKTPALAQFLKLRYYDPNLGASHGQEFQVLWREVVKITRFPEVLLEKAGNRQLWRRVY